MLGRAEFVATLLAEPFIGRWGGVAVGWLLTYAVHSTIILTVAWLVASRRRVGEAAREIIWKSALIGGVVTASLQATVAPTPLGGQLRLGLPTKAQQERVLRVAIAELRRAGEPGRLFVRRQDGAAWTPLIAIVWLAGAGTALLWLTFGHARVMRALADRSSLDGTPVADRLAALLRRAGVESPVTLTCSGAIASPIALVGGEICLPRRALIELDGAEQESMLAHEVAHIVRRDPYWLVAARVIESVFFFQPLNRLARVRMQEAAEYLCDDWAVQRTDRPVMLAKCLATVAEWVSSSAGPRLRPASAMVESNDSPFLRRVGRILGDRSERGSGTPRGVLVATGCALVLLTGAAPRVSVPSALDTAGTATLLRRIERRHFSTDRGVVRDSVIIFATRGERGVADSLVDVLRFDVRAERPAGAGRVVGVERVATGPAVDGVPRVARIMLRYSDTPPERAPTTLPAALSIDSPR